MHSLYKFLYAFVSGRHQIHRVQLLTRRQDVCLPTDLVFAEVPPSASGEVAGKIVQLLKVLDSERRGGHNHDRGPRSAVCNSDLGGSFLITTTTRSGILFLLHAVALAHHFQVIMSDDKPLKRVVIRANRVQTEILKAAYTQSQTASGEQLEILFEQTGLHVLLNCSWLLLIVYPYL